MTVQKLYLACGSLIKKQSLEYALCAEVKREKEARVQKYVEAALNYGRG